MAEVSIWWEELVACAAVLHHTAEAAIGRLSEADLILPKRIPISLREGMVSHCVLDWRTNLKTLEAMQRVRMLYTVVSGKARRYVNSTLAYTKQLGGFEVATSESR